MIHSPTFPIYTAQYGSGLGGLFSNLLKRGLTSIGKKALETGISALDQHSKGVPIKTALKSAAKQQFTNAILGNSSGGTGAKKQNKKKSIKPGVKRKSTSLSKTTQMQAPTKKKRKPFKTKEKRPIVL